MITLTVILRNTGVDTDPGLDQRWAFGCSYPRREPALARLARQGASVLISLRERKHDSSRLSPHGWTHLHLPVEEFSAPSPPVLKQAIAAIGGAVGAGQSVAVRCGGGLGQTGALPACYPAHKGWSAKEAIVRVRGGATGIDRDGQPSIRRGSVRAARPGL